MNIIIKEMPDITDYMQYIHMVQLDTDTSIIFLYKTLFRDDSVLVDIYMNDMSDETILISGRRIEKGSLICLSKYDEGLEYDIYCIDQDGVDEDINRYSLGKFYLQFIKNKSEDLGE